ncbi:hypothetical protein GGX14DRAFT_641268 [Mycena pura]|uniref:Uncharacterized protein n=1 Tax=Mycena pura TaxID=153505 RepID=A0AAD6YPW8_9AGAR|nr:hypothetical protein GGX14DRAFT_641268 [Mycena pura]
MARGAGILGGLWTWVGYAWRTQRATVSTNPRFQAYRHAGGGWDCSWRGCDCTSDSGSDGLVGLDRIDSTDRRVSAASLLPEEFRLGPGHSADFARTAGMDRVAFAWGKGVHVMVGVSDSLGRVAPTYGVNGMQRISDVRRIRMVDFECTEDRDAWRWISDRQHLGWWTWTTRSDGAVLAHHARGGKCKRAQRPVTFESSSKTVMVCERSGERMNGAAQVRALWHPAVAVSVVAMRGVRGVWGRWVVKLIVLHIGAWWEERLELATPAQTTGSVQCATGSRQWVLGEVACSRHTLAKPPPIRQMDGCTRDRVSKAIADLARYAGTHANEIFAQHTGHEVS